jgi:hypothetical protein
VLPSFIIVLQNCKAAPAGSLTSLLARYTAAVNTFSGGEAAVALLWSEFVQEVRCVSLCSTAPPLRFSFSPTAVARVSSPNCAPYSLLYSWHWDNRRPMKGIPDDEPPSLETCVLHQRLQLINWCIAR